MLLNPKNEEAIYNLAKLKLINSDYKKSRELNKKLKLRNLVQFSNPFDFKNILLGGLKIFKNRYIKQHYEKDLYLS